MRWNLLGPLLVTTIVAALGWYVVNYLNGKRDLRNTVIELRIKYLLEIYKRLERTMGKVVTREIADDLEIALADLQLLGTPEQVSMALEQIERLGGKSLAELNTGDLLFDLRRTLREDLNLDPIEQQLGHFRLHVAEDNLKESG